MAMTISGLSEAQLDDQLIAAIQANVPLLDAFSTLLEGEGNGLVKGNSYIVPVVGSLTLSDKTAGTTASANAALTGKSVTADSFKGVSWELTEGSVPARLAANYMAEQAREGVAKIAQVDGCLFAVGALVAVVREVDEFYWAVFFVPLANAKHINIRLYA